jgi:hypothetical protein
MVLKKVAPFIKWYFLNGYQEVRYYVEVGLAEVDEGRDEGDRIWNEMYQLDCNARVFSS